MNFKSRPIIIEGVNHSGTRLLVDILSCFGSDGGDYNNEWNENKFFLKLHNNLIEKISNKGWTDTILNINFIDKYQDNCEFENYLKKELEINLLNEFPKLKDKPWHWKCPTSALFEPTWVNIFPDGWYIINQREPEKIARAFLRRRASIPFNDGIKFYKIMEDKILSIKKKKQLIINFDNLNNEINRIADFIPLDVSSQKIKIARSLIKYNKPLWSKNKSIYMNFKNVYATYVYNKYKKNK